MQKMIFSAVALVAFSFAGMANEIEEKKVEAKTTETKKVEVLEEKVVLRNNCDLAADAAYELAIFLGASPSNAHGWSELAYNQCLDWHNKKNIDLIVF